MIEFARGDQRRTSSIFDEAVMLAEPFLFSVAFENDDSSGWLTEKIFNSLYAGCIPIFWGSGDIKEFIQDGCYVDANDFTDLRDLAKYLFDLRENETKLLDFLSVPPLRDVLDPVNSLEPEYG